MSIAFVLVEVVALLFESSYLLSYSLWAGCWLGSLLGLLSRSLLFDCFLGRGFLLFLSFLNFDLLGHW